MDNGGDQLQRTHIDGLTVMTPSDALAVSVVGNSNPNLVSADLVDRHLTLTYGPDGNGEAQVT